MPIMSSAHFHSFFLACPFLFHSGMCSMFWIPFVKHVCMLHALKVRSDFPMFCIIIRSSVCNCGRHSLCRHTRLRGQPAVFVNVWFCFSLGFVVASAFTSNLCILFLHAVISHGLDVWWKFDRHIPSCACKHNKLVYARSHRKFWSCPAIRLTFTRSIVCAQY